MTSPQGYKLLVSYDYIPDREMAYRRFMIHQWLPAMQALGLEPMALYHTLWGAYPVRLVVLYAPNETVIRRALIGEDGLLWRRRLEEYVVNLSYCIVPARAWFQFC